MKNILTLFMFLALMPISTTALAESDGSVWLLNQETTVANAASSGVFDDEENKIGLGLLLNMYKVAKLNGDELTLFTQICEVKGSKLYCPNEPDTPSTIQFSDTQLLIKDGKTGLDLAWDRASKLEEVFYMFGLFEPGIFGPSEPESNRSLVLLSTTWKIDTDASENVSINVIKQQSEGWKVKNDKSVKWIDTIEFHRRRVLEVESFYSQVGFSVKDRNGDIYEECIIDFSSFVGDENQSRVAVICSDTLNLINSFVTSEKKIETKPTRVLSFIEDDGQFGFWMGDKMLVFISNQ